MEIAVMEKLIWKRKGGQYYAFSTADANEKHSVMKFNMTGTVTNSFLRAEPLSHEYRCH